MKKTWIGAVLAAAAPLAQAIPIQVNFDTSLPDAVAAPYHLIQGTIVYEATELHGEILGVTSADIALDGNDYEVAGFVFYNAMYHPGAGQPAVDAIGIQAQIPDTAILEILFGREVLVPYWLNLWTPASGTINLLQTPGARTISTISALEPAQVPEPAILALLGIGLAGLGLARRRQAAPGA